MGDIVIKDPETTSYQYETWACRVSTQTGTTIGGHVASAPPVLKSEISRTLRPYLVSRSAGGHKLDYADFVFVTDVPLVGRMEQPASFTKMVDVLMPDHGERFVFEIDGEEIVGYEGSNTRVFLGDFLEEVEDVSNSESLAGRGVLSHYLFGDTFRGMTFMFNGAADQIVTQTGSDMIFNPMIDGVVRGNRSSSFFTFSHHWCDPELSESTYAQDYHNQTATEWSLVDALKKICESCNAAQTFILNPVIDETDPIWVDPPPVKDLQMQGGRLLPYYLDELLHPLGYNWWVDPNRQASENTDVRLEYPKPIIRIMRKGYGNVKQLYFQPPGEKLRFNQQLFSNGSNVNEYRIARNIGNAFTAVRVIGDRIRVEVTVPLYPGWKASADSLDPDSLAMDAGSNYAANKHVHRLWVANEGASWTGMRADPDPYPIGAPPDFSDIFALMKGEGLVETKTLARKRPMEPPLTYIGTETERVRRDLFLQYSDDSGATWKEVTGKIGGWSVLGDQIGIIFNGNRPPATLVTAFRNGTLRMRITGTIASDHHLYNVNSDGMTNLPAVQGRLNRMTMEQQDRYRHWFVLGKDHPRAALNDHPYKSALSGDVAGADTHDDRQAIETFATRIIKTMVHANYDGSFSIPGWTMDYEIGDLLSHIVGRQVGLNESADADNPQYMQITGIEWGHSDDGGPVTRLIVDRGTKEYVDNVPRGRNAPVSVDDTGPDRKWEILDSLPSMNSSVQTGHKRNIWPRTFF